MMLETIRQFAEEQLAATADREAIRGVHARYYAGLEGDALARWNGPHTAMRMTGSTSSGPTCEARGGGPPIRTISTLAVTIAILASFLGYFVERLEHLRLVLGRDAFEALARHGQTMDTSSMVRYALEQVEQTRHTI